MSQAKPQIDRRIRRLVAAINKLPGLRTFSSCGGHRKPTGSQVPQGQFTISIEMDRTRAGWKGLELLTWAIFEIDPDRITLMLWPAGDQPESMCASLDGCGGIVPDRLAAFIEKQIKQAARK